LKRSNRLVLFVGVFLAIVAFVGILLLVRSPQATETPAAPPTTGPVVVALVDIPLSTRIREDQVATLTIPLTSILPGAYTDPSQVIGQIVRQPAAKGAQITSTTLSGGTNGVITNLVTPVGLRSIAIQVDQVSGVGTAIKTGDYVDMIIGLTGDKFPVITINPADDSVSVVSGLNSTSVKVLLQGLQVIATLLPPATTSDTGTTTPAPANGSITLNGQAEIVILAVTAQQAEVIKFAQMDSSITLALRSPDDFIDPLTGEPLPPVTVQTTGVILKTLVDSYGVLPPEVVQTVTPTATSRP
jgi:pilus assembly protein CpaB